jgi:hypothetical protein
MPRAHLQLGSQVPNGSPIQGAARDSLRGDPGQVRRGAGVALARGRTRAAATARPEARILRAGRGIEEASMDGIGSS